MKQFIQRFGQGHKKMAKQAEFGYLLCAERVGMHVTLLDLVFWRGFFRETTSFCLGLHPRVSSRSSSCVLCHLGQSPAAQAERLQRTIQSSYPDEQNVLFITGSRDMIKHLHGNGSKAP